MERITSKLIRVIAMTLLCATTVMTASSQTGKSVDLDALAARGEAIANEDPLAVELRNQQAEGRLAADSISAWPLPKGRPSRAPASSGFRTH